MTDQTETTTKDKWQTSANKTTIRVQRGVTTAAAIITIDPVDMTKAFILSNSKASAGQVATSGNLKLNGTATLTGGGGYDVNTGNQYGNASILTRNGGDINTLYGSKYTTSATGSLTGGTTDLTTKQYSARLISETQIQCDGAVEWQLIEIA